MKRHQQNMKNNQRNAHHAHNMNMHSHASASASSFSTGGGRGESKQFALKQSYCQTKLPLSVIEIRRDETCRLVFCQKNPIKTCD